MVTAQLGSNAQALSVQQAHRVQEESAPTAMTLLPKKDLAGVRTREKWNYSHINIDSKMPSQTVVQGLIYTLSYELVRGDSNSLSSFSY